MKKLIVVVTVCVFAVTGKVSAQGSLATLHSNPSTSILLPSVKLKEGDNTVPVRRNGRLSIALRLGVVTKVEFIDSLGVRTLLNPTRGTANGAPKPECKTKLPDVCFSSPDKNIGLCICKPGDLSNGEEQTYLIGMLLPAVQKVREAAARN